MKICIVGCGAVGSLFAAHLAKAGEVEVWAYDVWKEHTEAIRKNGLRLSGAEEFTAKVHATSDPKELPQCDYGIVATKAIHTRHAIAQTARAFGEGSAVCSVQNGVGNEEILAEYVKYVEDLAGLMTRSGMNTVALQDARGAQWTKLIFNASTNPVGALTLLHHGAATRFAPTGKLFEDLIGEGEAVANALGIELHGDPRQMVQKGANAPGKHRASMLQDVLAKRQTEIDFMNGAIVKWGEQAGVPTPLNRALWELIKGLEQSWTDPD
jgi:2-dehydropantoate 2-reductase